MLLVVRLLFLFLQVRGIINRGIIVYCVERGASRPTRMAACTETVGTSTVP
jgi:hypothetical protein